MGRFGRLESFSNDDIEKEETESEKLDRKYKEALDRYYEEEEEKERRRHMPHHTSIDGDWIRKHEVDEIPSLSTYDDPVKDIDDLTSEISDRISDEIDKIDEVTNDDPISRYVDTLERKIDLLIGFIEDKLYQTSTSYEEINILEGLKGRYDIIKTFEKDDATVLMLESLESDLTVLFESVKAKKPYNL